MIKNLKKNQIIRDKKIYTENISFGALKAKNQTLFQHIDAAMKQSESFEKSMYMEKYISAAI